MTTGRPDDFENFLSCYRHEHWTASKASNLLAAGVRLEKPSCTGRSWFDSLLGGPKLHLQCEQTKLLLDLIVRYVVASKALLNPALDPRFSHFRKQGDVLHLAAYLGSWLRILENSLSDAHRVAYFTELGYFFPTSPHNKPLRAKRERLLLEAEIFEKQRGPDPQRGPLPPLALENSRKEAQVVVGNDALFQLLSAHQWGNSFFRGRASLLSAFQLRQSLATLFPCVHKWTELEAVQLQISQRFPPEQLGKTRKQGLFGKAEPY